ncbi:MAG: hypothetical protein ACTHK9_00345 [Nitrobacter sp.]
MTHQIGQQTQRRLVCSGCGTEFGCNLSGNCWCAEETARLPMPARGGDCLCRDCLRKAAARSSTSP